MDESLFQPVDVLAIGAHPDDVELGCAGALLCCGRQGDKVGILDLTRGELGSRGNPQIRGREAARAAKLLKVKFRENLELQDGDIDISAQNRLRIIEVLRICRPNLVLTHCQGGHPDHGRARQLVMEAVHHSGLARIETAQARFRPDKIAFWIDFRVDLKPQVVVDVSEVYELKEKVLRAYRSQLYAPDSDQPETYLSRPDFLDQLRAYHRHLGNLAECRYGEAFLLSRPPRIRHLLEC